MEHAATAAPANDSRPPARRSMTDFERSSLSRHRRLAEEDLVRLYVKAVRLRSWRVEYAAVAELLDRIEVKRGRGHRDVEGKGRRALLLRLVAASGGRRHVRTLLRGAQIHRDILSKLCGKNGADVHTVLNDRSFFEEAIRAPNPLDALRRMVRARRRDRRFSARKARRLVAQLREDAGISAKTRHEPERAYLERILRTIETDFTVTAPRADYATRYFSEWAGDVRWELENLDDRTIQDAIVKAWRERGCRTSSELAAAVGITKEDLRERMEELRVAGVFLRVRRRSPDLTRGEPQMIWHLKGQPLGDGYVLVRPESSYYHEEED